MYRCKICDSTYQTKTPKISQQEMKQMMEQKGHLCFQMLFKEQDNINQNRGLKQIEERKKQKKMSWYCVDCDTEQIKGFNICHACGSDVFEEREKDEMI